MGVREQDQFLRQGIRSPNSAYHRAPYILSVYHFSLQSFRLQPFPSVMAHHKSATDHIWTFYRISGLDQVALKNGSDLLNLKFLDQKLWVALSCPVKGLEIDERTLELIDTDKNGRIRVPEILNAIDWCAARLKHLDDLIEPKAALPIELINDTTPEGKTILSSVKQIQSSLGQSDEKFITASAASDPKEIFANTAFNGDGVITPAAGQNEIEKSLIAEIIKSYGGVEDRSGQPGINQQKLDQFLQDVAAHEAWRAKGQSVENLTPVLESAAASSALNAVRAKVDDFFARASLASFDPRALAAVNRHESDYVAIATKDLTVTAEELASFPLAKVEANRALPLTDDLNPAWNTRINELRKSLLAPVFGADIRVLSAEQWKIAQARLIPYETWQAERPAGPIRAIAAERIQEVVTSDLGARLTALIARDKALEPEAMAVTDVEQLARYYRDLGTLLRNFVNFADFYNPNRFASFQAGTLYFDSRSCNLCVRVEDPNTHSILASLSKSYIAYCDLKRGDETIKIAACFTQGDSDYLMVGRNGLFYDRKGRDWDATITKIIDNPISIAQAFWSPYKKFIRFVGEQVAKRAAAAESKGDARLANVATVATAADTAPKPPDQPKRIDVGSVAALGVAVGALSTAFAYFLGLFKGLLWWEFPLVIVGMMLVISLPSTIIAWLKLRQRTIGPILDATGWAVNARVKINIPFGTSLTRRAKLPPNSIHRLDDPFKDKTTGRNWSLFVLFLLIVAAGFGFYAYKTQHWPFNPPAPTPMPAPVPTTPKA